MPGYFVFVRFFLGYSDSFPFERFLHLNDADIGSAVEALRKEWLSEPANAARLQASRRDLNERVREWNKSCLARPGTNWHLPGAAASSEGACPESERPGQPSFEEIAVEAGWGHPTALGDSDFGISHRYPLREYTKKEAADVAAAALQERVKELARSTYAKQHWNDEDYWLATANPRFVVVAGKELSRAELATACERIHRLSGAVGEHPSPEEGFLRSFLPNIRSTLEQINELFSPEEVGADRGDSQVMASAASKTTGADGEQRQEPLESEPPCYDQRLRHVHPDAADALAEALAQKLSAGAGSDQAGRASTKGAGADRNLGGAGRREAKKGKRKRGRRPGSRTAAADTRLYRDWKAAHNATGISKADFIRERGLPASELLSLERGRANVKRTERAGRKGPAESSQEGSN